MEEEMEKMGEAETVAEAAKEAVETLKEKRLYVNSWGGIS